MSIQMILQQLTMGFGKTLLIFFLTLLFSMPLGLLVCFGRMSKWAPFRFLVREGEQPTGLRRTLAAFKPIKKNTEHPHSQAPDSRVVSPKR